MECLLRAEAAERAAFKRKAQVENSERRDLAHKIQAQPAFWRDRDMSIEVAMKTDKALTTDAVWKSRVADNQWYIAQATMYGIAALVEQQMVRRV